MACFFSEGAKATITSRLSRLACELVGVEGQAGAYAWDWWIGLTRMEFPFLLSEPRSAEDHLTGDKGQRWGVLDHDRPVSALSPLTTPFSRPAWITRCAPTLSPCHGFDNAGFVPTASALYPGLRDQQIPPRLSLHRGFASGPKLTPTPAPSNLPADHAVPSTKTLVSCAIACRIQSPSLVRQAHKTLAFGVALRPHALIARSCPANPSAASNGIDAASCP